MLMSAKQPLVALEEPAAFVPRHIGVAPDDEQKMLSAIGVPSRSALIEAVVPRASPATTKCTTAATSTASAAAASRTNASSTCGR